MTTREWPVGPAQVEWRDRGVAVLAAASRWMMHLALRMARARVDPAYGAPVLEFYAEAGAPEGALYVDGKLVGHLVGVQRL